MEDAREVQNLQPGLASAPVLFASEECPQLLPVIQRYCTEPGDIELVSFIRSSQVSALENNNISSLSL